MADTVVQSSAANSQETRETLWGPYWADEDNGIIVYGHSSNDLYKAVTSDGGANWTNSSVYTGTIKRMSAYYDKETPGNTGTLVHIAFMDVTASNLYYINVDASDGTAGTLRTVDSTISVNSTDNLNRLTIGQTVSGNLLIAGSTQAELICYKSTDDFATAATSINDVMETANQEDHCLIFPANTADDNDATAIFWDRSANELSVKMWDDSAGTWTETSISGSMTDSNYTNMDGATRHSDGHLLLVAHSNDDHTTDDLRTWDINPSSISSPTVTAKTNVFTNQGESAQAAICINQQNDDVYVAYIKGGTWLSSTDVVFHKSTDDLSTWGTEQAYNETSADIRRVSGPRSIDDSGGFVQWSFFDDDLTESLVNLVNDVAIAAASGSHSLTANALTSASSVDSPAITQEHDLTANALTSASSVDSPSLSQVHGLSASSLASTSTIDSPALSQGHSLTATGLTSTSTIGSPSVSQEHSLNAGELSSNTAVDSPALGQVHDLTAGELSASSSVGSPSVSESHTLTANGLSSSTNVGSPGITQAHSLTASELSVVSSVESPALGQVHALNAVGLSAGTEVGTPTLTEEGELVAVGLVSSTSLGSPALSQAHTLTASGIVSSSEIEAPAISQTHALNAVGLDSSCTVGSPELSENGYALVANGLASSTEIESPSITQHHNLVASGLVVSTSVGVALLTGEYWEYPLTMGSNVPALSAGSKVGVISEISGGVSSLSAKSTVKSY